MCGILGVLSFDGSAFRVSEPYLVHGCWAQSSCTRFDFEPMKT